MSQNPAAAVRICGVPAKAGTHGNRTLRLRFFAGSQDSRITRE